MRYFLISCSLLLVFISTGCSVLTSVRVLEKDHSQYNLSIGGPWVPGSVSTVIIPYCTLGYAYGIKNDLTLSGNFHLISAIFKTPGIDIGAVYRAIPQNEYLPEISVYPKVYFFYGFREPQDFRWFPSFSVNASYLLWKEHLIYLGVDCMFQLTRSDSYFTPFIGYEVPVSNSLKLQTEFKWMASNAETRHGVFEGESSISGRGTMGIFVGVNYGL
jgi:hypothetical protein